MNGNMYGNRGYGPRPYRSDDAGISPVNVGEELDVKIEAVGEKGDGIARKDGFVLFVPNTQEGDQVKVRITKVLRRVGFAEVIGSAQPKASEPAKPKKHEDPADSEDFGEESEGQGSEEPETEDSTYEDFEEEPK